MRGFAESIVIGRPHWSELVARVISVTVPLVCCLVPRGLPDREIEQNDEKFAKATTRDKSAEKAKR